MYKRQALMVRCFSTSTPLMVGILPESLMYGELNTPEVLLVLTRWCRFCAIA